MEMFMILPGFVLYCSFLFQPSLQTAQNDISMRLLTKLLSSVSNYSAVVEELCRASPNLIIPHPDECQLYYNCSLTYGSVPSHFEQYLMECNYPDLFSEKTHQCSNFTEVCCGARKEIKEKCLYRKGQAEGYCDYPSCVGQADDMIQTDKLGRYKICFKERLLKVGKCKLWFELPYQGKCTSRLEIPMSFSEKGLLPSCHSMPDGIYRFTHSSDLYSEFRLINFGDYYSIGRVCDAYYRCTRGAITVVKCKNGTVFDRLVGACRPGNASLPDSCQLYCNPEKKDVHPFPVNVEECPYPLQFSETTRRCENFTDVICGGRKEEKYACSYWKSRFSNSIIDSCSPSHPSLCLRVPDGVYHHPNGPNKAFIRCFRHRLVEEGICPTDQLWGTQTYPFLGNCTQRFAIPMSITPYGRLPTCNGKPDGNYPFSTRPCDAYYRCDGGRATAVKCPDHTYFDVTQRKCATNVACYRA